MQATAMDTMVLFERLAAALAVGLLIGLERGWTLRDRPEGARPAGVRTFALIGLLGGVWALVARAAGPVVLAIGFAAFAALLVGMRWLRDTGTDADPDPDRGLTTMVAALLTFALGALAVTGEVAAAAAGGVVTALLLNLKPTLHGWLQRLSRDELRAVFKLGLISVVILPVLPDRGFGPWAAFNPYTVWWLVVLIAGISFLGYLAMRVAGPERGIALTGLFGGLASSTATTLSLARLAARRRSMSALLASGTALAAAVMFPRLAIEVAVVNPALLADLAVPLTTVTTIALAGAGVLWWRSSRAVAEEPVQLRNPCELGLALQFGVLLALMMLFAEAARHWFGDAGLLLLAGVAGLGDVDAIALSVARMARDGVDDRLASGAILLAAASNTAVKVVLAAVIGGRALALYLVPALGLGIGGGALAWWLG